jgi:hypothetical protein
MKITFFKAGVPLTKSFAKQADGSVSKSSYPNVYEVTSIEEDVMDMKSFATVLKKHAALGHCLVKGTPTRSLVSESRAGTTDSNAMSEWLVFDVDGLANVATPNDFMKLLGFDNVSYVVQYSASYKITSPDLRCHIFVRLDKPMAAPLIKQWLMQLNHGIPALKDSMSLTKTGNSLSWALDISACQNDKLLYIAPPLLKGIKDPMAKTPRIDYIAKNSATLSIQGTVNSSAQNRELSNKRINEIRTSLGYPERKTTYKMHGSMEVLSRPDSCVVSDIKAERGYVYFNLNGGDSWGYFHPEDQPDYIHNFKGEPAYLTKELLPEYWNQLTQQATRTSSSGITYLAFCDKRTGAYWRGTYTASTNALDIYQAKNETQVRHFAKQNGLPLGDYIPEWELVFDPNDVVRVDTQNQVVNLFEPTVYMQQIVKTTKACPKTILKVVHHVLGSDADITDRFINWLAYILQNRCMAKTAWVMNGTTGTGKGILMSRILRPLLGPNQTAVRRAAELNEPYNAYMEQCLMVFVDEVEVKVFNNEKGAMANIKNFVTEENITIRAMYQASHEVRNYTSWIFNSNKPDPLVIDKEDRRFNIGKYQTEKLDLTQDEIERVIATELQTFHDYLMCYAVDAKKAQTPMESAERDNMMSISESSVDMVSSALREGCMGFFIEQMPTGKAYERNIVEKNKVEDYIEVLIHVLDNTDRITGKCGIPRDMLRTMFDYSVGSMPTTPNKFTSLLKHHRIHVVKIRIGKETMRGLAVIWKDTDKFDEYRDALQPKQPVVKSKPSLKVVKK